MRFICLFFSCFFAHVFFCMLVSFSVASDSATPRIIASQSPLSREFSRQEYWSGLPFPSPGGLLDPGTELGSLELQAGDIRSETSRLLALWLFIFEFYNYALHIPLLLFLHVQSHVQSSVFKSLFVNKIINFFLYLHRHFLKIGTLYSTLQV